MAQGHGCKVAYKPVFLGELFAETGGLPLAKRHPARQRYRMMELQRWREKRGLNFHLQPQHWPFDPKLADGVVIAAVEAGLDPEPFMRLVFKSTWEDQLNLGDPATITDLAEQGRACRARSWSHARRLRRSLTPMNRTGRTRSQPACSVRPATCSTARCSGARIGSSFWAMR